MLTALIMAGGSGERFWPLSTPENPKQLLKLFSNKTMIRETVDRIIDIIPTKYIFIATNRLQANAIIKELPDIPIENIIIEPDFKDTAAAIGYSSLIIEKYLNKSLNISEKIGVLVLASDHIIKNVSQFHKIIKIGEEEINKNSTIVTIGIKPNKPETGYGYIEIKGKEKIELNKIYKVNRFREKPNLETAEKYLLSDRYFWNSGMFMFTINTIFKNFDVLMEEHSHIFKQIKIKLNENLFGLQLMNLVKTDFEQFEKISIDFGIMEYSKNIRVIPSDIGWNDVGDFNALDDIFEKNIDENIIKDSFVNALDSTNNIIIANDIKVSLLGVNDLVIIKHNENLLITKKNRTQDIKKLLKL